MIVKLFLRTGQMFLLAALLVLGGAGRIDWAAGWVFLGLLHGFALAVGLWLARHDPALLQERLAPLAQPGQEPRDRWLLRFALLLWSGWIGAMALDAGRFGWSQLPLALQVTGGLGIVLSCVLIWATFRANSFASPVVKIQSERGHQVVSSGPYAYVRHPMYAGAAIYFLAAPLLLGSWLGLALAPLMMAVLIIRIPQEERVLRQGLAGYDAYAERVRCRLVPGVW
ncbi:MAG: isoprenylcysteine carboxylmethyltransferase family protein [Azospirillum sp.]|nr:isoprenylcysteine carboxylmethyltransferase family protein [Azospirillum sp.]